MRKAMYPGTFDPPTLGHLNIAKRAAGMWDHLFIAVGENPRKKTSAFTLDERVQLFRASLQQLPNVEVVAFQGLLVDCAANYEVQALVRSVRSFADFEYETTQGSLNKKLGQIETVYLMVDEEYRLMSSTWIREIAQFGRRLHGFVPAEIEEQVFERLNRVQPSYLK